MKFQNGKDPTLDFSRYPDREVLCMGIPYAGSKLVDGLWFFHHVNGDYLPFAFQAKVQEVTASCGTHRAPVKNIVGAINQAGGRPPLVESVPIPIAELSGPVSDESIKICGPSNICRRVTPIPLPPVKITLVRRRR